MFSISVVIPAYNAESTIEACLKSVFRQTRQPEQIIVVDDGSSDRTTEVASQFDDRVYVVTQANQGSAKARQTGSEHATSTHIAYLDSDDWWLENHLEELNRLAELTSSDFIFTDLQRAVPGSDEKDYLPRNITFFPWAEAELEKKGEKVDYSSTVYKLNPDAALKFFLRGFPVYPSTMLVSKEAVMASGGWDSRFRRCQDFDFTLRTSRKVGCLYVNRPQVILGLHSVNSDVNSYVVMQTKGDIKVLNTHLSENTADSKYISLVKESLAIKHFGLAATYLKLGKKRDAISSFYQSIGYPGKRIKSTAKFLYLFSRSLIRNP